MRRWTGFLALPPNMALGARLAWESADALWRWAGDTATDENHYSKRALLAGILSGALAIRLSSGRGGGHGLHRPPHRRRHGLREVEGDDQFRPSEMLAVARPRPDALRRRRLEADDGRQRRRRTGPADPGLRAGALGRQDR